jgi:hypothetical protein
LHSQVFTILIYTVGLFAGMLICLEIGQRIGSRLRKASADGKSLGTNAIEGAVFALFGLLIAFTFSGAAARFEARCNLVIEEANNMSTAWLRMDLLPQDAQPEMRELFREFLDKRLSAYRNMPDLEETTAAIIESEEVLDLIWSKAVAACEEKGDAATTSLVLGSFNDMFDVCNTRSTATKVHPPLVIFLLLFALGLSSALLAGAATKTRSWVHMTGFALIIFLAVFVTLELEFPRLGLIRVDSADHLLNELQDRIR